MILVKSIFIFISPMANIQKDGKDESGNDSSAHSMNVFQHCSISGITIKKKKKKNATFKWYRNIKWCKKSRKIKILIY